jgi:hypothetical protein
MSAFVKLKKALKAYPQAHLLRNVVRMSFARRMATAPALIAPSQGSRPVALIVLDHGFLDIQSGSRRVVESQIDFFRQQGLSVHGAFIYAAQSNHRHRGRARAAKEFGFDAAFELGADFAIKDVCRVFPYLIPASLGRCSLPELIKYSDLIRVPEAMRVATQQRPYEAVLCNYVWNVPVARKLAENCPLIVETHDIQVRQIAYWLGRAATAEEENYEFAALSPADGIIALNCEEFDKLSSWHGGKVHLVLPSVGDVSSSFAVARQYDAIFAGSRHRPNFEGLVWFLKKVLPLVQAERHDFKIAVVGSVCELFEESGQGSLLHQPGVYALGRVDDISGVYRQSAIGLVPILDGHGISIKTIEILAYGLALATTAKGLRGFPAQCGLSGFDQPQDLAGHILSLLADESQLAVAQEYSRLAYRSFFSSAANTASYKAALLSAGKIHAQT